MEEDTEPAAPEVELAPAAVSESEMKWPKMKWPKDVWKMKDVWMFVGI